MQVERTWPDEPALAMAYVIMQRFSTIYSPEVALAKGTLFPALYKPFRGRTIGGCDADV